MLSAILECTHLSILLIYGVRISQLEVITGLLSMVHVYSMIWCYIYHSISNIVFLETELMLLHGQILTSKLSTHDNRKNELQCQQHKLCMLRVHK